MRFAALTSLVVLAAAVPALAQDETARKQATEVAARVPLEKATTGAPYSADTVVESTQVLADGNRISRKTTGRVFRDGEGRTRREDEQLLNMTTAGNGGPVSVTRLGVSIVDPVAGYSYSLDRENRVAWRTPLNVASGIMGRVDGVELKRKMEEAQVAGARAAASGTVSGRGGAVGPVGSAAEAAPLMRARGFSTTSDAPLEHRTIDGLVVEGRKTTTVIPAGQIGNEQPLTITSEEWRSPELGVLVLTRHSDPRTGESTYRLVNIVRAEPDRSLFMVPPDYEIKDTGIRRMLEASRQR